MEAEIADLQNNLQKLEADLSKVIVKITYNSGVSNVSKANKNHVQDLRTAHEEYTTKNSEQSARLQRAEEKVAEFKARCDAAIETASKAEAALATKEEERRLVQGELDDLLMVFGDLEERCESYKDQLKALGENVSDAEDEEEEGEEESEEGEDEKGTTALKVGEDDVD